jgi:hypothetical protein
MVRDGNGRLSVVLTGRAKLKKIYAADDEREIGSRANILDLEGFGREKLTLSNASSSMPGHEGKD